MFGNINIHIHQVMSFKLTWNNALKTGERNCEASIFSKLNYKSYKIKTKLLTSTDKWFQWLDHGAL